jgi:hypothetical protein
MTRHRDASSSPGQRLTLSCPDPASALVARTPIGESPIGCDHDHAVVCLGDGGDRVVALAWRMHNFNAVHVTLVGARPGSALEYQGHRCVQPSGVHRRPGSFQKTSCSAGSITPPTGWPRPDHVGGVNYKHPNSVAQTRIAG